ncbi:MAG: MFS transporter [Actinobacteria bacterium]|nr:MFS transporter [Actinomycetota bacterium]
MTSATPIRVQASRRPGATGRPPVAGRRHRAGFWLVAYAFAVTMAFSAVPTPLYVLYQARDGFGAFTLTLIFAVYAVGVSLSLLLAGHLSDWAGRRRMLAAAIAVNLASGVLFLTWPSVPGLLVARFVSGVSIGLLTATATAHLTELHRAGRRARGRVGPSEQASAVSTAANLGGIGLGPLLAGLLAQYGPDPLHLSYLVGEGLMVAALLALMLVPETVTRPDPRPAYRPQRVSVPPASRPAFWAAGGTGAVVFSVFGLFTSLAPSFLAGTLHDRSHALAGVAAFAVFGAAALSQIMLARVPLLRLLVIGITVLVTGLALVTVAVWVASLALLLIGGVLAGAGAGATFKATVATVIAVAPDGARGEALAGLFLAAYLGLAVPVIGLGVATQYLSAPVALLIFAAALLAALATATRRLYRSA